ncbi:L-arabinokinase [Abeliophyllum distichum]|uniref:L-arabinokinase n=1 Tax=Abeliophyllum distichum TaxID=126358 RepID=A0ABD1SZU3_9LAMI
MESPKKPLVFAYYVTGHGFGHATRVVEVVRNLIQAGHDVHVVTAAPDYVFTYEIQSPKLFIRKVLLDCGAVQADALTVDRLASLEKYVQTAVVPRASILSTEVEWLKSIEADLVVSDVVPVACRAAADAGIRYCPMPPFRDTVDVPLVVRRLHKSRAEVRKELGIGEDIKVLIYNFGGQPAGWKLKKEYLPDGWMCLVCGASEGQELPENFVKLPKDVYTPDLIAASDCMLGKIGYGTASEALAYKVPFIFIRRDYFNEEPFVRNMLECFQCGVEMIRRDLLTGHWAPYMERALTLKPCYEAGTNGGEVAAKVLQDTAIGKHRTPCKLSGPRRLRDAIVLGYQLQRVPGKDISVPEWYTLAQNELNIRTPSPDNNTIQGSSFIKETEDFEILHGDHHGLPDTIAFLKNLAELHALNNPGNRSKQHSREQLAVAALFNWEEEIFVARAPGRLDVMGGISDYSGGLVLQMPIREACHVAIQRNHPSRHKLWKHTQARQHTERQGPMPVLQIVSFGSELSNRAPTFDMDLSDFMDGERPISYEKAYQYFAENPSQKWAAYIAGTILVLMTELGVRFEDSISILVISAVPEGKGVSSSAAIEVATMSAVAASHGLDIAPRDLALLCQKVENLVVGAPCGVMDQMASACGESNKLLAMVCQPAEVLGLVEIPPHIRFWGFDSGIRHSVGGADYGSVRTGAFMGRKIIKSMASEQLKSSLSKNNTSQPVNGINSGEMDDDGIDFLENEASLDYLCNLSPHRYEASYVNRLPEILQGNDFIENYVHHDDSVTIIDKKTLLCRELMYQCHYGYNSCGLGSHGTDKLVELAQEMQHSKLSKFESGTLYGAKITGGGSGGSVCVIGKNLLRSSEQILQIQQKYKAATGFLPFVFEGSSPGAGKFGYLKIVIRSCSQLK